MEGYSHSAKVTMVIHFNATEEGDEPDDLLSFYMEKFREGQREITGIADFIFEESIDQHADPKEPRVVLTWDDNDGCYRDPSGARWEAFDVTEWPAWDGSPFEGHPCMECRHAVTLRGFQREEDPTEQIHECHVILAGG